MEEVPPRVAEVLAQTAVGAHTIDDIRAALRAELCVGLDSIRQIVREELDREDDDDAEEEDAEPRCPKGHPLRAAKTPNDTYICDKCKTSVKKGTTLFGCRGCNYDECENCCGKDASFFKREKACAADGGSDSDSSWGDGEDVPEDEARKLVICVRCDLGMSIGKTAAQVGHAVHSAVRKSSWQDLQAWEACGSKKVTLKVDSQDQLLEVKRAARGAGLVAESIRDAGHTELEPGTMTVLAVGPALNSVIDPVTGHLKSVPDNLKRENEKLKEKNAKLQAELDQVRQEKKKLRQEKLHLLELSKAHRGMTY